MVALFEGHGYLSKVLACCVYISSVCHVIIQSTIHCWGAVLTMADSETTSQLLNLDLNCFKYCVPYFDPREAKVTNTAYRDTWSYFYDQFIRKLS